MQGKTEKKCNREILKQIQKSKITFNLPFHFEIKIPTLGS